MKEEELLIQNIDRFMGRFNGASTLLNGLSQTIFHFLKDQAIVIPNPCYGKIIYENPDDYCYPEVKALFDENREAFKRFYEESLSEYYNHENMSRIPKEKKNETGFYWNNGRYGPDARVLYSFLAHFNPEKFIEVGVGNSTMIARMAIDDFELKSRIISIDPAPRAEIAHLTDHHIDSSLTTVGTSLFKSMKAGDILFIDGSHVFLPGTDVSYYTINIFPVLQPGVVVHIHDIQLPWEHTAEFRRRHYNEQHVLAAMLVNGMNWDVLFPTHYMVKEKIIPYGGSSLWLQKR